MPSTLAVAPTCGTLIQSLDNEGIQSWSAQAAIFANMTGPQLQTLMEGDPISNALAREIEWAMHRPSCWLRQ